jgi:hypothetical protein
MPASTQTSLSFRPGRKLPVRNRFRLFIIIFSIPSGYARTVNPGAFLPIIANTNPPDTRPAGFSKRPAVW